MSGEPHASAVTGAPDDEPPPSSTSAIFEARAPRPPWPAPGATVLETRGVCRDLGGSGGSLKTRVLHDVNLTIREGEFVSLTGFSGSGKSTLLYLLGALDRPSEGEVVLDGADIARLDDDERAALRNRKFGFVFQFHFLLPEFTVLENVMLPMLRRGSRTRADIEEHAYAVIDSIGLGEFAYRRPNQLSGGQQQRVSIARAVANDPRILLADEPTGNLDTRNGVIVMDVFERLARDERLTVVMVTHERIFARRASRQVELRDGRVVADIDQSRLP